MIRLSGAWKIYLPVAVLAIAAVVLTGFVLETQLKKRLQDHLKEEVLVLAKVAAKSLPQAEDPAVIDRFCRDYQAAAGVRVTVIRKDGQVIGESDPEANREESRLDRPEVQRALQAGSGSSVRYSASLDQEMLYLALLVERQDRIIRLSMPMQKVRTIENEVMGYFALALYLIPLLAAIIALLVAGAAGRWSKSLQTETGGQRI